MAAASWSNRRDKLIVYVLRYVDLSTHGKCSLHNPHLTHRAFDCDQAKTGESVTSTSGPRQSVGVHHPNSRAHTKVWESMVKMSQKKCEKGWKWVKVGENRKYSQCGRSMKTYAGGNNDAPSITKHGSPVRIDAQIVALRPHCAKGTP